jgi:integrase/recombinase XerD
MNIREGIEVYIEARRSEGTPWTRGAKYLRSLSRQVGDVDLASIRVNDVAAFLDGPLTSPMTWYKKYSAVRGFFSYWKARSEIYGLPLPPPRRSPAQTFVPYVYSRTELRRLLLAAGVVQRQFNCVIDGRTFRTLLLFLYGTGVMIGEAVELKQGDVDLRGRSINIQCSRVNRSRVIPIGPDLCDILLGYHRTHHQAAAVRDSPFFLTKNGTQIKTDTVNQAFQRVRKEAGVARYDGARYQPRMHDLRHTFAVHRLTAWFRHGADMSRMIPALSAYMGQRDIALAERYLRLTPERFRTQLNKLSPKRGKKRWRDNAALMKFVESL